MGCLDSRWSGSSPLQHSGLQSTGPVPSSSSPPSIYLIIYLIINNPPFPFSLSFLHHTILQRIYPQSPHPNNPLLLPFVIQWVSVAPGLLTSGSRMASLSRHSRPLQEERNHYSFFLVVCPGSSRLSGSPGAVVQKGTFRLFAQSPPPFCYSLVLSPKRKRNGAIANTADATILPSLSLYYIMSNNEGATMQARRWQLPEIQSAEVQRCQRMTDYGCRNYRVTDCSAGDCKDAEIRNRKDKARGRSEAQKAGTHMRTERATQHSLPKRKERLASPRKRKDRCAAGAQSAHSCCYARCYCLRWSVSRPSEASTAVPAS